MLVMIVIGLVLLWLAIHKKFEPLLLVGIAVGVLLTNLPGANLYHTAMWDAYSYGCPYDVANDAILYDTENSLIIDEETYRASLPEDAAEPEIIEKVSFTDIIHHGGLLDILYIGVKSSLYPCLIFIGIGAMTDFGPSLPTRSPCCWAPPLRSVSLPPIWAAWPPASLPNSRAAPSASSAAQTGRRPSLHPPFWPRS